MFSSKVFLRFIVPSIDNSFKHNCASSVFSFVFPFLLFFSNLFSVIFNSVFFLKSKFKAYFGFFFLNIYFNFTVYLGIFFFSFFSLAVFANFLDDHRDLIGFWILLASPLETEITARRVAVC